jgi:predicted Zn-dependent protease
MLRTPMVLGISMVPRLVHCLSMVKRVLALFLAALICGFLTGSSAAQVSKKAPVAESSSDAAERGISLATKGHCADALPILKKSIPHIADKDLRYDAAMARAQCGMSADQVDAVVEALLLLNHEFPGNPKVLYVTTRYYSELANRTAQKLLETASSSAEAQVLVAEAFQAQGRWDEAAAQYRKILEKYPNQPGIHYQLGRILLSKPLSLETTEEAKKEFEAELKTNPASPAAEFMLGDLAWRGHKLDEAIEHFSRATQFDAELPQPYLGLGLALNTAGRYSQAIPALKKYVEMVPSDTAGYYQLAIAYARTGNKQEADRLMALHRELEKKKPQLVVPPPQEISQPH